MKNSLIIGNWKLNGNKEKVSNLINSLKESLKNIKYCDIVITPPMVYLDAAKQHLINSKIFLGAQNVDIHCSGAFTGETSVNMLKDIGVKYVIIGHSERRINHKENDEYIAKKFLKLKKTNLTPILCIGENKIQNQNNQTTIICKKQLNTIINKVGIESFENTVIAYEPIWAIGTGKSALPLQVQKTHKFIRNYLSEYNSIIAQKITIQYGGSVTTDNAAELFLQPDVDGFLIGNSSLKSEIFTDIVKIVEKIKNMQNF